MSTWLADAVRSEGGRITFERFMELALYHPVHGYYTGHVSAIGRSGDFSTGTTIGDSLIRSVAGWLKAEAKRLSMQVAQVIELGGGSGRLASGVLGHSCLGNASGIRSLRFQAGFGKSRSESYGEDMSSGQILSKQLCRAAKGEAILISNEFVDAFPCQRFEREAQVWKEISLGLDGDLWREEYSESLRASRQFNFCCEISDRSTR